MTAVITKAIRPQVRQTISGRVTRNNLKTTQALGSSGNSPTWIKAHNGGCSHKHTITMAITYR